MPTFRNRRGRVLGLFVLLFNLGAAIYAQTPTREILNPYKSVQWDGVQHYLANLHTHTMYSDGDYTPHAAIDAYHQLGYRILALTDHDNDHYDARPAILYPWTNLSGIFEEIREERNRSWRWTARKYGSFSAPWENRDPEILGMVSVEGTEISLSHHIVSLFNDYAGYTFSEEEAFVEIGKRGGLAVFAHPGRYKETLDWYVSFYEKHDHLIGVEVYNQKDRHSGDRDFWDRLLHRLMPDRPVWGFAGDDMHQRGHLGWNYTVLPLEVLNKEQVRSAIEAGAFYFFKPRKQMTAPGLRITSVEVDDVGIRLSLEGEAESVNWICFNPETEKSEIVHQGTELSMAQIPEAASFVRARIIAGDGSYYTQPFAVKPSAR